MDSERGSYEVARREGECTVFVPRHDSPIFPPSLCPEIYGISESECKEKKKITADYRQFPTIKRLLQPSMNPHCSGFILRSKCGFARGLGFSGRYNCNWSQEWWWCLMGLLYDENCEWMNGWMDVFAFGGCAIREGVEMEVEVEVREVRMGLVEGWNGGLALRIMEKVVVVGELFSECTERKVGGGGGCVREVG
jgi:hypothetical protein